MLNSVIKQQKKIVKGLHAALKN